MEHLIQLAEQKEEISFVIALLRFKAEAVAWPLVSPDAFRQASSSLQTRILLPSFRARLQQLGVSRAEEPAQDTWNDNSSLEAIS